MRTFLFLVALLALIPLRSVAASPEPADQTETSPRERTSFNDGWLFSRTDAEWVLGQLD